MELLLILRLRVFVDSHCIEAIGGALEVKAYFLQSFVFLFQELEVGGLLRLPVFVFCVDVLVYGFIFLFAVLSGL